MSKTLDAVEENIFKLKSNDIKNNTELPNMHLLNAYGCNGGNKSPQLSWINPPINTKSFAIVCHDPDAPKENGWYHWLVINIPLNINSIKQGGKIENSIETLTDFNNVGYGGACPPIGHGVHRYNFTVYALNIEKLDIEAQESPKIVENEIKKHAIAKSTITALYERK